MDKDEYFKVHVPKPFDFQFTPTVAGVFDDMVNRSVPLYGEIQRMIGELAAKHAQEHTFIYDLGCATGTSMIQAEKAVRQEVHFIGIDDSQAMLDKCRTKLQQAAFHHEYTLQVADLNHSVLVDQASVVILCLTLQFVRPINRERLLKQVFDGMITDGVIIIVEKVLAEDSNFNRDFIDFYYAMKRRHHYSDMEIAQKREALENVLIPYKVSENIALLERAGFRKCEVFFKWYNFAGVIAKKTP